MAITNHLFSSRSRCADDLQIENNRMPMMSVIVSYSSSLFPLQGKCGREDFLPLSFLWMTRNRRRVLLEKKAGNHTKREKGEKNIRARRSSSYSSDLFLSSKKQKAKQKASPSNSSSTTIETNRAGLQMEQASLQRNHRSILLSIFVTMIFVGLLGRWTRFLHARKKANKKMNY